MLQNTNTSYGWVARLFHWLMAIVFIGLFGVAYTMMDMGPSDTKWALYGLHKATGMTILGLSMARLWWRLANPVPQLPKTVPSWQIMGANFIHYLLYALMFLMPLSGYLMSVWGSHPISWFGLFTLPMIMLPNKDLAGLAHSAHFFFSYILIGAFSLHVLGALYHHCCLKDRVLTRMLKG